ncbi:MAG: DUF3368 domain-containing protein [Lentisphaeria bacterium]
MIVVADASPLIFLGKLRQFDLLHRVLGPDVRVPRAVYHELLVPAVEPAERQILETFLGRCRIEAVPHPGSFAKAMSAADNAVLTLAVRSKADLLLCDERITRTMAEAEGIRPLGTLGVLLRAMRQNILPADETRRLVDRLVSVHNFRISIEVYQAALAEISRGGAGGPGRRR